MRLLLLLVLLLAPAAPQARAAELELGWVGRAAWESNIFRTSNNEESDFSGATGPQVRLRERSRAFDLDVSYRVLYEEFLDTRGVGAFEHHASAYGAWRATPRDSFSLTDNFTRSDTLIQLFEAGVTGIVTGERVDDRQTITRNSVSGEYRRQLGELSELRLTLENTAYWPEEQETRSDSLSSTAALDLTRLLSPRQRAGAGFAVTRQDFAGTDFSNESGTTFLSVYGIWSYEITRTLSFATSIGPRLAIPDDLEDSSPARTIAVVNNRPVIAASCPPTGTPGVVGPARACLLRSAVLVDPTSIPLADFDFPEGREQPDETLGFFGRVSLSKRWEHVTTSLSYQRSASSSSGLGASTDLDVLSWRTDWHPRRAWRLSALAAWERQQSASEIPFNDSLVSATGVTLFVDAQGRLVDAPVPGGQTITGAGRTIGQRTLDLVDNAIDVNTMRVLLSAQHDLTRRLTVSGTALWWRQQSEGEFQADDVVSDVRIELSLTWRFAPIDL
jgi:hypothetical protein